MARVSLQTIMLVVAYAAVCSTVFATSNMWAGWLVVWATALWMAIAIVRASKSNGGFSLGFAVAGCFWLTIWLGFAVETSVKFDDIPIRTAIYDVVNFGRNTNEYDESAEPKSYAKAHDLYMSLDMTVQGNSPHVPNWHNAMRLVVCLSALVVGCMGGMVTHYTYNDRLNAA
ncbi:hypothetical protein OAG71_00470 [bacterium]|nr:hypothetical protein [bacterium]